MPRPHPLSDLVQSIHLAHPSPQGLSRFILSTFPSPSIGEPVLVLYGSNGKGELHVWSSRPGEHELDGQWDDAAGAIKAGLVHLNFDHSGDVFDEEGAGDIQYEDRMLTVQLQLHPQGAKAISIDLHPDESGSFQSLFEAALSLLSRPTAGGDSSSELRSLRAELSKKEAEIAHLTTRLQSAKAEAARSSSQDTRKKLLASPQKKQPANASALQPNQKRRKAVEDEFAGSSGDDDDDE